MESESIKVAKWIKEATIINRKALCEEAKMDRGNLDKFLSKGEIPEKHLSKIIPIISKYGYSLLAVKEEKTISKVNIDKAELTKELDRLKLEKIPAYRNTSMGKKVWEKEIDNKIIDITKKINDLL